MTCTIIMNIYMAPRRAQFNNVGNNYIYVLFIKNWLSSFITRIEHQWYKNSWNFKRQSAEVQHAVQITITFCHRRVNTPVEVLSSNARLNLISSFSVYCLDV